MVFAVCCLTFFSEFAACPPGQIKQHATYPQKCRITLRTITYTRMMVRTLFIFCLLRLVKPRICDTLKAEGRAVLAPALCWLIKLQQLDDDDGNHTAKNVLEQVRQSASGRRRKFLLAALFVFHGAHLLSMILLQSKFRPEPIGEIDNL